MKQMIQVRVALSVLRWFLAAFNRLIGERHLLHPVFLRGQDLEHSRICQRGELLRHRQCRRQDCGAIFVICVSCDRRSAILQCAVPYRGKVKNSVWARTAGIRRPSVAAWPINGASAAIANG